MIIVDSDNNLDCFNMNYNNRSVNNDQFVTCNNAHIALNELKIVCIPSKEKVYFSSFTVIYNNVCDDIKNDNILLTYMCCSFLELRKIVNSKSKKSIIIDRLMKQIEKYKHYSVN